MGVRSNNCGRTDHNIAHSKFPNYKSVDYKSYKFSKVGVATPKSLLPSPCYGGEAKGT